MSSISIMGRRLLLLTSRCLALPLSCQQLASKDSCQPGIWHSYGKIRAVTDLTGHLRPLANCSEVMELSRVQLTSCCTEGKSNAANS